MGLSFALAFLSALAVQSGAAQVPPKPGDGFDVERYDVSLRPDFSRASINGSETVTLRVLEPLQELLFSPNALKVDGVRAPGHSVAVDKTDGAIRFRFARRLKAGEHVTLRFTISGKPARGFIAMPTAIATGYFACDWMVCLQDSPGDKALFDLALWLPAGNQSFASGKRLSMRRAGTLDLHRWRGTTPRSPYLYGFAAGTLSRTEEKVSDNRFDYFGTAQEPPGRLRLLFAPTARIAQFYVDKSGIALPGRSYAQIAVAGSAAQEADGFGVIGTDHLEARLKEPQEDWAIAHELAHMWWGNSITAANWQELWLNEGVVVFMTAAWKERAHGRAAYDREMALAQRRWDGAKARGWDRPLAFAGRYPDLGIRRAIQYSKGALFLDALRRELGEKAFWRGIRLYGKRHWNGTVTSRDFEAAMSDAAGRDLAPIFAQWVYPVRGTY